MSAPQAVFLLNLLQDVNIARPLILLVAEELGCPIKLLVSARFLERDSLGIWQEELRQLAVETGAAVAPYASELDALRELAGGRGMLVAASESDLSAHVDTHNVLRVAPSGYLRVTLQHGYECVGFLQNRDQYKAHGRHIGFAADVICGWCDPRHMSSIAPGERSKYLWTGPMALLQRPADPPSEPGETGLVCENLHSPRMSTSGNFRVGFMDSFASYCDKLAEAGRAVTLRPHPGGQYVIKQGVALAANVELENRPIYRVDLRRFRYGISAPSSVLIDMVLAGIPTAVWQDDDGVLDASNYAGLTVVATVADWLAFERDARLRPAAFAQTQADYLRRTGMLTDAAEVRRRYLQLFSAGLGAH